MFGLYLKVSTAVSKHHKQKENWENVFFVLILPDNTASFEEFSTKTQAGLKPGGGS